MPEPAQLDSTPRSRSVPPLRRSRPAPSRRRLRRPRIRTLAATLTVAATLLGGPAAAQDAAPSDGEAVTPEQIAALIPDPWHGLAASEHKATIDRSGGAMASARYDDTSDQRASRDLSLAITDLGPYRDATLLVERADAAAGRVEEVEVAGFPAFAAEQYGDPTLEVFAGRMWVRTRAFGELFSAADLRAAVEELPLGDIAALSQRPVTPQASYRPTGFTPGALRHFLPDTVLGLSRSDGYYAKRHPAGVVWGGYPYHGSHAGADVRLRVTVWDLGTLADASRQRLADLSGAWHPFTANGYPGFTELGTPTPRVLLYDGRFRLQVDAPGQPGIDAGWLQGAFSDVNLERLAKLAELVPAPQPARDPLRPQPELISPDTLATALPATLEGMQRGDVQAEVSSSRGNPYDTAYATAAYQPASSAGLRVTVVDQGLVSLQVKERMDGMRETQANGHTVYLSDEQGAAMAIVADRLVVTAQAARGDGPAMSVDDLATALGALDFAKLSDMAGTAGSS